MNQHFIDIAHRIGIDKSIAYTSSSRIVGGIAGVGSIFFTSTFLTKQNKCMLWLDNSESQNGV